MKDVSAMENEELLPCPFCGSDDLTLQNLVDNDDYYVSCGTCEVQQIANYTPEAAAKRWNTRANVSAPVQPGPRPKCPKCDALWINRPGDFREWIAEGQYRIHCSTCGQSYVLLHVEEFLQFFPVAAPSGEEKA